MKCHACGAPVPPDALYCNHCGIHLESGMRADGDAPDSAIYPLLAAAHLLCLRKQWDAAREKCVEALRLYPSNATAHSILGDTYFEQRKWEEAIQWYALAVELDPENQADRDKLANAQRHAAGADLDSRPALAPPDPTWTERVLQHLSPPVQLGVIAFLSFVVVLLLISTLHTKQGTPAGQPANTAYTEPGPGNKPPLPPAPGQTPTAAAGEKNGAATPPANATPENATPVPAAPQQTAPMAAVADLTEQEGRTLSRLQAQVPVASQAGQGRISDVRVDPLSDRALVTVVLTRRLEKQTLALEALRAAYRAGQAFTSIDTAHASRFTVLVKAPVGTAGTEDVVLAAAVDGTQGAWQDDAAAAHFDALLAAFSQVWWHPDLKA